MPTWRGFFSLIVPTFSAKRSERSDRIMVWNAPIVFTVQGSSRSQSMAGDDWDWKSIVRGLSADDLESAGSAEDSNSGM